MTHTPFHRIAIIGLGLIGGSLAKAIRQQGKPCHITGCNRHKDSLANAKKLGIIDEGTTDPAQAVKDADLIILGAPLLSYPDILKRIQSHIPGHTVITDVGSVKKYVIDAASKRLDGDLLSRFIPGHPIAGSEKSGVEASDAALFTDKRVILTPHAASNKDALAKVKLLWQACGAQVEEMDAVRHDRLFAENSHLVQLLAFAYMDVLKKAPRATRKLLTANWGVFQKFTRLGASNPTMWGDIYCCNQEAVSESLHRFLTNLDQVAAMIEAGDSEELGRWQEECRQKRESIQQEKLGITSIFHTPEFPAFSYLYILPYLIAGSLMETVTEPGFAGPGLKDFTENLIAFEDFTPALLLSGKEEISKPVAAFSKELKHYAALMAKGKAGSLQKCFSKAVATHKDFQAATVGKNE